jgi:medium-chain acyl-[acyl-carrier-protein] hydrolase
MFSDWKLHINETIVVYPVDLSGRGQRFGTPLNENMTEAVNDIFSRIENLLDESEYAFFGHSLGCWIAYELALKIQATRHRQPRHIFLAAKEAPHCGGKKPKLHTLPMDLFKKEIIDLGGTRKEIYQNDDVFNIFLPIIRSDYKLAETYSPKEKCKKLQCDLTVLYGKKDSIELEWLMGWNNYLRNEIRIYPFEGGHFFIFDELQKVIRIVNTILSLQWSIRAR